MVPDQLRVKQGPLARAWLASHWEKKVSKSQCLQTNLERTIDAITTTSNEDGQMTLRVSGQLLLGVARIYSRKTKYLLEDCNEALVKIKLAFKKGDVNMPNIQHSIANSNTITVQNNLTEFDILLPDVPFSTAADGNLEINDPLFDALGDSSTSQNNTLTDVQNSFSFGNWISGPEAGRRDTEALEENFLEANGLDQMIEGPLKELNLADNNNIENGLNDNNINFDFDDDNIDYDLPDITDEGVTFDMNRFNAMTGETAETTAMSSLGDIGIVEDDVFDTDSIMAEPAPRKRRLLIVDNETEIPAEDLTRYIADASSIIVNDEVSDVVSAKEAAKIKKTTNLRQPYGDELGSDLNKLFQDISHRRHVPVSLSDNVAATSHIPRETEVNNPFHFEDDAVDYNDDGAEFNEEAMDQFRSVRFLVRGPLALHPFHLCS
ncbi:Rec8 like protein-domain-containing protein [Mycotypha africana]|uniref:Rec8 like protein-domain-containing protein n=1 Tax=Mycotypha africana TaxID=64632 RepID=UPI002300200B|nr:Rec8 like protein-domain-containing protein [Mycotypha africana]KAI8968055.1 Rec8 like protein-domain-containing protein [Mycotypha africana]